MQPRPLDGLQFPLQPTSQKMSTTQSAKELLSCVLEPLDPALSHQLDQEKNWRKHYPVYFKALVRLGIQQQTQAVQIAQSGLDKAHDLFQFYRQGQPHALKDAMQLFKAQPFYTHQLRSPTPKPLATWSVPYQGKQLSGQALLAQIDAWENRGIMEASHAHALRECVAHPEWFDLSDRTFVLFGAASEAGPLTWLCQWQANIVAVDLDRPAVWQKIVDKVMQGNATLYAPSLHPQQPDLTVEKSIPLLGANLLTQTPEIANWLQTFEQRLDLAALAYLDGEKHVRVALAMDAIMQTLCQTKPDSSLMFMCTPTDIYAVPHEIAELTQQKYQQGTWLKRHATQTVRHASLNRFFQPNSTERVESEQGQAYGISDCLVIEQGPNYALAKRIQQWRAVVAHQAGQTVSINIAPSTTTHSVVKNPLLKAAFAGAKLFDVEAFAPETTNALMAALWIYDLRAPDAIAQHKDRIKHPLDLIHMGANHGGLWRVPYLARTALPFAALYGFAEQGIQQLKAKLPR